MLTSDLFVDLQRWAALCWVLRLSYSDFA